MREVPTEMVFGTSGVSVNPRFKKLISIQPLSCPEIEFSSNVDSQNSVTYKPQSDVDINTSDTSTPTHNQISGPITRARACQLNNQVSPFLASYSSYLDNGNMCSVSLLRNDGKEGNGVAFAPVTFGF
jgi:hypothetical protein